MNTAAFNNTNNDTYNHTDNHAMLHWFYSFTAKVHLTTTAQCLRHCLYHRMDGTAAGRFYEIASTSLEDELGICRKTLQRARIALTKAWLIRCKTRGRSSNRKAEIWTISVSKEQKKCAVINNRTLQNTSFHPPDNCRLEP